MVDDVDGEPLGLEEFGDAVPQLDQDGVQVSGGMDLVDLLHEPLAMFQLLFEQIGFRHDGAFLVVPPPLQGEGRGGDG